MATDNSCRSRMRVGVDGHHEVVPRTQLRHRPLTAAGAVSLLATLGSLLMVPGGAADAAHPPIVSTATHSDPLGAPLTPPGQPTQRLARESACGDVLFLGAMGSGERPEWKKSDGFGAEVKGVRDQLVAALPQRSVDDVPVDYPARSTDDLNPLKTKLSWPARVRNYFRGLSEGVDQAEATLKSQDTSCPSQAIVLAGYSQGAMVMHRALLRLDNAGRSDILERIAGVVMVADGDRVPHSNIQMLGDPPAGAAGQGVASVIGGQPNIPSRLWPYAYNMCTKNDLVCDFRGAWSIKNFGAATAVHSSYRHASIYKDIAAEIGNVTMGWAKPTGPVVVTAEAGTPVSQQLTVSVRDGWLPRVQWAATRIPAGWTLSSTGLLSGAPTADGTFYVDYVIRTSDRGIYARQIPGTVKIVVGDVTTSPDDPPGDNPWTPTPIDGLVSDLDCVGANFCGAVADEQLLTWSGGHWTEVPVPGITDQVWANDDADIDCPAVARCYATISTEQGWHIATYRSGRWSTSSTPLFGSVAYDRTVRVTCSSASSCVAVGVNDDGALRVASLANGRWKTGSVALADPRAYSVQLSGEDCLPSLCLVAVNYQEPQGNGYANVSSVVRFKDGQWSSQRLPIVLATGEGPRYLRDLSCAPTEDVCIAGGESGARAALWTYKAGTWTPALALLPAEASTAMPSFTSSVECQESGACGAVVYYNSGTWSADAGIIVRHNGLWTVPGGSDRGRIDVVADIACSSQRFCVAVGYTPTNPAVSYAWNWSPGPNRWTSTRLELGEVDTGWLSQVDCGTQECAATGLIEGPNWVQTGVGITRDIP